MSHSQLSLFRGDEPSPSTDQCRLFKDAVEAAIAELESAEKTLATRLQTLQACIEAATFSNASKTVQGIVALTTDLRDELSIPKQQAASK